MPRENAFRINGFCRTILIATAVFLLFLFWSGPVNLIADENPAQQATRMLAGLASDIVAEGSLQDGPGKLYLPIIFKNYDPALYALVPNVQGLTQSDAEAAIVAAQLTVGNVTQGTSPTVPAGMVMNQDPKAGSYAAKGAAVNLVISTGPSMVNVPDVVGSSQSLAEGLIVAASLVVGTVTNQYHETVPVGSVISQSPTGGTLAAAGTAVNLWVSLGSQGIPPDPSTVAPPINPTVATNVAGSTEFLYTGAAPIQGGVSPGTIEPRRAAVIRGKVLERDGQPLPGATITILNHPEFGQTLSRADGMFDMAVNGGGYLTVKYQKNGYLEVQRQLNVPWQDYVWASDVVLIPLDSQAAAIDLTAGIPFQLARGSVTSDNRGTRQSTLLFAQGTQAELVLPNGTTQPISNLTVRSTEYTVGENGPKAMPGELPPGVGYTYAVELSVDEGLTAGSSEVRFNQPVIHYVENFLGFAAGVEVPAYYYDRKQGRWVPFPNGRVIKIVSINGNMAELDVDGDDAADSGAKLTDLGITDAERQRIASLYSAGQSLWRVTLLHFSPADYNFSYKWPPDAYPPPPAVKKDQTEDDPCTSTGSIIECQNQNLGESVRITGTPFTLNYRSERVPGRLSSKTITIPLTGPTIYYQNIFLSVELEIKVAGRLFSYSYPPQPNLSHTFTWDGLDAYGRKVQGAQPISISLGYKYMGQRCDGLGNCRYWPDMYDILWTPWWGNIGAWDSKGQGLAAWTLDVHHSYEPSAGILHLGSGQSRSAESLARSITTVAGIGRVYPDGFIGDGGPATAAQINAPFEIAVGPDGSFYFIDNIPAGSISRVRRVGSDGIITTVAGNGTRGFSGDGGPATAASIYIDYGGVAVGPDGSFYFADRGNHRIRRVGTDGIITTVAGNGTGDFGGDGGPATAAALYYPMGVAAGQDGTLYIADQSNHRIRRVGTDGIITTVAGKGRFDFGGDGGPATLAALYVPSRVAVKQDASFYIIDAGNVRIRRVGTDGIITTVAGNGDSGFSGDGGQATAAALSDNVWGLAVRPDGGFYIADQGNNRIRRVGTDGIITTVAGNGDLAFNGDGGPATAAAIGYPSGVDVGQDGNLYIADMYNCRIRRVSYQWLHGQMSADSVVGSSDGREIYVFDGAGRHARTLNTLTGSVVYQFTYDTNGKLIQIKDGDNNITNIERDTSGNPMSILGPYGQRTTFTLDANGYLAGATNPANETTSFQYTSDGLMTRMTTPRGHSYIYTYDSSGRLIRDDDPAGGFQTLTKTQLANGYEVTRTTALGVATIYRMENLPTGDKQMTNTAGCCGSTEALFRTDGSIQTTSPGGTVTTLKQGPDPRFGMQSPLISPVTHQTPGGLQYMYTQSRSVSLSNPNDPLSLMNQTDTISVNGRTYTRQFLSSTGEETVTTPRGRTAVIARDLQGRVTQRAITGIEPVFYGYDTKGRLVSTTQGSGGETRQGTISYDGSGRIAAITDPLSHTLSYTYDAAGRLTKKTLPDGREVNYTYDGGGNLASITPPGKPSHTFTFTPVNLAQEYIPPDLVVGEEKTVFAYNLDRQVNRVTRPDGKQINLGYDGAGRVNAMTMSKGTTGYSYDPASGRLSSITTPDGGILSYTLDGPLLTGLQWQGEVNGTVGFAYDNNFRVVTQTVNGGNSISFGYDEDALLVQAGGLTLTRNGQNGLNVGSTLGSISNMVGYNAFGEMASYSAAYNTSEFYNVQVTRNKVGRITGKVETIGSQSNSYLYYYDPAGRLTEVKKNGDTVAAYSYDSNSNRISAAIDGVPISASYDSQDRLLQHGSATYSYTANGELQSKTVGANTTDYAYDEVGNLISVTLPGGGKLDYLIDGQNRRIGKKVGGTLVQAFLYNGELSPVAELDGSGSVVTRFIYGSKKKAPDYLIKGGNTYRIISDHLGSVRLVVDAATGVVAQRLDYDPFGKVTLDTNPAFQPFGFAGGLYDTETKLTRFGARDYDAETGRWTSKDPIGFSGRDTNLYGYVFNDPLNLTDPSGLLSLIDCFIDEDTKVGQFYPTRKDCEASCKENKYRETLKRSHVCLHVRGVSLNDPADQKCVDDCFFDSGPRDHYKDEVTFSDCASKWWVEFTKLLGNDYEFEPATSQGGGTRG